MLPQMHAAMMQNMQRNKQRSTILHFSYSASDMEALTASLMSSFQPLIHSSYSLGDKKKKAKHSNEEDDLPSLYKHFLIENTSQI